MLVIVMGVTLALSLSGASGNPALEEKAREIENELIAPCCWTQPVSKHYSQAADEIRRGIRSMLAEGKTEQQILDFYVAEYGERILSSPRAVGFNSVVYVLPWVALVGGMVVVVLFLKRLRAPGPLPEPAKPAEPSVAGGYAERLERELRELE
jgi:cytochrome c-type biogenesis protein CcmH